MEDTTKTLTPTRAEELVLSLSEKVAITASARNVYGEPIHAHNRTIVPVAKFGYGLGATSDGRDGDKADGGSGGGGGGAKLAGYVELTEDGARYVPFATPRQIPPAALAGIGLGYLLGRVRRQVEGK
jgi:uncharacterized spore protein YtfJ